MCLYIKTPDNIVTFCKSDPIQNFLPFVKILRQCSVIQGTSVKKGHQGRGDLNEWEVVGASGGRQGTWTVHRGRVRSLRTRTTVLTRRRAVVLVQGTDRTSGATTVESLAKGPARSIPGWGRAVRGRWKRRVESCVTGHEEKKKKKERKEVDFALGPFLKTDKTGLVHVSLDPYTCQTLYFYMSSIFMIPWYL